ncbi:polyketide cyclase [Duganella sp. FT80W]|uniref:Polyketide cyclase n=1 Tax=Duganella guangzhouensis TaxID=2666084 RepID=A0A6I2LBB7_9BURK|nr:SRPBCC family protein [Duganella guangzhouensis]MRW94046.1 polyketide cyclase [Duganella guangzhouensis]
MFKKIVIVLAALIVILLGVAAMQPATYSVQRSVSIKAPPEKIIPLISDFHNWAQWSPWENLDPNMKRTFSGAPKDLGAVYAWEGNKEVGSGRMEVVSLTPAKVGIKLDFLAPRASSSVTEFILAPQGDTTTVNWTMSGDSDFMTKLMTVFVSLDSMIGPSFESGLAKMKAAAEK